MAESLHEEKRARQLDRLSHALDSGKQQQVGKLLKNLTAGRPPQGGKPAGSHATHARTSTS